jgi:hypothetical protein
VSPPLAILGAAAPIADILRTLVYQSPYHAARFWAGAAWRRGGSYL